MPFVCNIYLTKIINKLEQRCKLFGWNYTNMTKGTKREKNSIENVMQPTHLFPCATNVCHAILGVYYAKEWGTLYSPLCVRRACICVRI